MSCSNVVRNLRLAIAHVPYGLFLRHVCLPASPPSCPHLQVQSALAKTISKELEWASKQAKGQQVSESEGWC
jgi:hypothetical protein